MLFVWVALYGLADMISDLLPGIGWLRGISLVVYDALFVFWILRTGRGKLAGLNPMKHPVKDGAVSLALLAVFPLYNSISAENFPAFGAEFLLCMLCAALTEELFFRGFLLSWLTRLGQVPGIVLTSLAFALLHCVNFLEAGGSGYVWLQILSSFFVSICYCAVTIRFGSILPCAAAHFLTNITGTGSVSGSWPHWGLWGCIAVYALWGWTMTRNIRQNKRRQ